MSRLDGAKVGKAVKKYNPKSRISIFKLNILHGSSGHSLSFFDILRNVQQIVCYQ